MTFRGTAEELLKIAQAGRPNVKYVTNDKKDIIGAWDENLGRYVPVAGLLLTGEWGSMEVELLVDGKPIPRNWVEVI